MAVGLAATEPYLTLNCACHYKTTHLQMVQTHTHRAEQPVKPCQSNRDASNPATELISRVFKVNTDTYQAPLAGV